LGFQQRFADTLTDDAMLAVLPAQSTQRHFGSLRLCAPIPGNRSNMTLGNCFINTAMTFRDIAACVLNLRGSTA